MSGKLVHKRTDADMRKRAAELYDVRNDLLRRRENGELTWREAFEEMYLQGFRKLTRPRNAPDRRD